ncbi:hypothetical protein EEL05_002826 [Escherichia coli]|nr:hypothetical protein [Escherichia coli]
MNIELLQQLCEASAVSGDEQEVRDILINTLEPCVNEITFDGLGSFYSAAIFLIPICISFDTAEKRRYATYLILNRRFSFEF